MDLSTPPLKRIVVKRDDLPRGYPDELLVEADLFENYLHITPGVRRAFDKQAQERLEEEARLLTLPPAPSRRLLRKTTVKEGDTHAPPRGEGGRREGEPFILEWPDGCGPSTHAWVLCNDLETPHSGTLPKHSSVDLVHAVSYLHHHAVALLPHGVYALVECVGLGDRGTPGGGRGRRLGWGRH